MGLNFTSLTGQTRLAYKLLVNDRTKFAALLLGITFAVFLILMMMSMFAGVLQRSSSAVINVGARMWVMDPGVTTPAASIPMPDYVQDAVRSIAGVRYAVPIYSGTGLVKLRDGTYQAASVVGLDDTSLFGRPKLIEGKIEDIYAENGFIVVVDADYDKLLRPDVGAEFEINSHRAVIVGKARVTISGLFGIPTLYTTYSRAIQYLPQAQFSTSYVLVEPKSAQDIPGIKEEVRRLGYRALTEDEFIDQTATWYEFHTGLGINILIMTLVSFIVGLSISGQTFYTFIIENLERFGALKAIGARGSELVAMILFQSTFTALTGYGLGIGLCAGLMAIAKLRLPDYAAIMTFPSLAIALLMVIVIVAISSYVGVRRVLRIEPFDIFRS
jgi:putative ABC transport system permease protein